jgi:dihydroorotase (multifunctional complex type)
MTFDVGFEGGELVSPTGRAPGNLYVADGVVAAVTADRLAARRVIDARGLLVMPGMVDTHVHLMDPAAVDREDFPSGTAAAARAGVTTIVEHTHAGPVRTADDLAEKRRYLRDRSRVDFGLAAHAWPDRIDEVAELWRGGITFIKVFTCTTHGVPGFDAAHLLKLFRRTAEVGAVCLVHSEDETITADAEDQLRRVGRDDPHVIVEWRSREAEVTALAVATTLSASTGARMVAAHVSHTAALELIERQRRAGAPVTVESCPQYFSLLEDEILVQGALRKFTPPARARSVEELDEMWRALADHRINHVATDHAPSTVEQKAAGSIWDVHFGLPGLDTTLPVLLDAAARGLLSYERVVGAYAETPARTYGMFPRKGSLVVGADADVVLVDPAAQWTVEDHDILSRARWSPFRGRTLLGRAVATFVRGQPVAEDGDVVGEPGTGVFVPGPGAEGVM